jgi:peptidoglycan/xylan/chitin deacetylase (PgdA/CDA1 family)
MKMIYPAILWDMRESGKKLFLTFDDGPTPKITDLVMNVLDAFKAKATFFCLGRNVERHPDLYKEIVTRGHATGNHTYSHLKGWKTPNSEYAQDIELAAKFIDSRLFRPPYGQISRSHITELKQNYRIVLWEVMSHDYEQRVSKERSLKALLRYTKDGSILVFHDSEKAYNKLQFILPRFLEHFSAKGYSFEALPDQ